MMRAVTTLFLLFFSLYASPKAAETLGYYSDYHKALSSAKVQKKPLMLVIVTTYCPWCRKFERKTLSSQLVSASVNSMFVPLIVDRNKDAGNFPQEFQISRIPTVFFIDPINGREYWRSIGYLNKREFAEALQDALQLYKEQRRQTD